MMLEEPLDDVHAECVEARHMIRRRTDELRAAVQRWTPSPLPPKETPQ